MGGCVGSPAGGRRGSASPSALSDSSLFPTTKNKPLKGERIRLGCCIHECAVIEITELRAFEMSMLNDLGGKVTCP